MAENSGNCRPVHQKDRINTKCFIHIIAHSFAELLPTVVTNCVSLSGDVDRD